MARSNEYLFPTEKDYKKAVNRGTVYECDNNQCADGTYVEMKAGHYFDGRYRDYSAIYKCVAPTGGNDRWEKVNSKAGLTKCIHTRDRWGWTGSDSDEYLYPTKEDYDAVTKTEYGLVYECDSNVCKQGTEVVLDSVHYFGKQKVTTKKRYVCVTKGGGDYWMELSGDASGSVPEDSGGIIVDPGTSGKKCKATANTCCDLDGVVVNKGDRSASSVCPEALEAEGAAVCSCTCDGNDSWTCNINKCKGEANGPYKFDEKGINSYDGLGVCKKKSGYSNSCKSTRSTVIGKACCDVDLADYDAKTDTCTCTVSKGTPDPTKEFKIENGKGICVAKSGDDKKPDDDKKKEDDNALSDCTYNFNGTVKCANGNNMTINEMRKLTKKELGGLTCEQFNTLYQSNVTKLNEFFQSYCNGSTIVTIVTGPDATQIANAKSKLTTFFSSAEGNANVWKDAEGKFNKARLASDLTAGVVLGTVGGVVSGVVIKKKQVEKGFEALHCTVGGQPVADWGDEFSVGLK